MELIQKLMYEAQEQGKTIAQLVKDVDTLNKFLKDFDEAAREEIIRVLNQMAEFIRQNQFYLKNTFFKYSPFGGAGIFVSGF